MEFENAFPAKIQKLVIPYFPYDKFRLVEFLSADRTFFTARLFWCNSLLAQEPRPCNCNDHQQCKENNREDRDGHGSEFDADGDTVAEGDYGAEQFLGRINE